MGNSSDDLEGGGERPLDRRTSDLAPDQTKEYSPETGVEESAELFLRGLALHSDAVPIPNRLGKYQIKGQIGRGGMGIVWKGIDPDLQRTVAIKVLSPHLSQSQVARRRFQREARAAAAINHENVLTIHSVEEEGETPFLVMEYVAGQSLKEHVEERGKLNAIEVIRLSAQIAQGLAAAHVQGVIHRDIKLANVMLHEGATRVRLMDFGLARIAYDNSDLTSHDHTVGTPAYMAPEQIMGNDPDTRADLFSLGCVMYCMLTGHSPFHGRNHAETIHKIMNLTPARLNDVDPSIPAVLSDIVEKLLRKNPDERYQSAFEVAEILCRILVQINQTRTDELGSILNRQAEAHAIANRPTVTVKKSPKNNRNIALLVAIAFLVAGLASWPFWPKTPQVNPAGVGETGNSVAESTKVGIGHTPPNAILPKLTSIVVGPVPDATCSSLGEAILLAAENCTITVKGGEPIEESIVVSGSALNGLTIKASPRARWRLTGENDGDINAVQIKDVSRVAIEGFDFEVGVPLGRCINVTGTVTDIRVSDCSFRQMLSDHKLSLLTIASLNEDPDSWIRLRNCQFATAQGPVMCLSINAPQNATNVDCQECQFEGPNTLVYLTPSCRHVRLAGNVFIGGQNAINLSLKTWAADSRIEIVNNTFVGTRFWIGLMDSFRGGTIPTGRTKSRVCNNLILGGERVQGGDDQWGATVATWKFASNWWETDATTKPGFLWKEDDWNRRIAEFHAPLDIPERAERGSPEYLVPAAGSPLLTSGHGGDLPHYVGAKDRRP